MRLGLDNINWENTNNNIYGKLLEYGNIDDYADFICLSRTWMYEIFSKRNPTVDELSVYSKILDIPMDELIVYEHDEYYPYDIEELKRISKEIDGDSKEGRIEEIDSRIHINQMDYDSLEIRNLKEFLMYLPLMSLSLLFECLGRIGGDFESSNNEYIRKMLNRLYYEIPSSPAKEYIDWYRDSCVRVKGDYYQNFWKVFSEDSNEQQGKGRLFDAYQAFVCSDSFQEEFDSGICDKRRLAIQLYEEALNQAVEEQKAAFERSNNIQ